MSYRHTSREAHESFAAVSGELDRAILRALVSESQGLTCEQIEERIGRSHQAVSGNLRHLVEKGYVAESGRYGTTRSGRKAIAWVVALQEIADDWLQRRDAAMAERARKERETAMSENGQSSLFGDA